jgi:hypothetical protein
VNNQIRYIEMAIARAAGFAGHFVNRKAGTAQGLQPNF